MTEKKAPAVTSTKKKRAHRRMAIHVNTEADNAIEEFCQKRGISKKFMRGVVEACVAVEFSTPESVQDQYDSFVKG